MPTRQTFKQADSQTVLPSVHTQEQFTLQHSDLDGEVEVDHPAANSSLSVAASHSCSTTASILGFLTALICLLVLPATLFKSLTPPTPSCPAPYTPTTVRRSGQPTIPRLLPPTLPPTWPGQSEPVAHLLYKLFNAHPSQYSWDYRHVQPNPHAHRVLVVHADDRPLRSVASLGGNAWALPHATMGPLYGAWWAVRHGYDYRRVGLTQGHTPQGGWGKPKVVYDALMRGYDVVVMFDSDAYVQMPEVGVEEMMARWGMTRANASLLLALDPPYQSRANENATNTGFWIVRNTPVAKRVMRELAACPESIECRKWWTTWPAEQAAFTKLVRTKMKEGEELIVAPCDEANGWWEFGACQGRVVTHAWSGKHLVTANMIERMVEWLVEVLEKLVRADHYHFQDSCVPWKSGSDEGERCKFLEDELK
ncbi:hypothetical protein BCR44DRAFT_38876 [Catenaria anguillulae PL171]|uniref:Uncharacterized protein n=1 Tax=Catenaria anguillulae PL171 TaxID=765915 RepID=A0A1Y2H8P7_9FUNG|nr:hypothetical protein BCR44DRAFT_38876 [Catenaria anguillulae PL171]